MSAVACSPLSSFAECECVMAFLAALANDCKTYGFGEKVADSLHCLLSVSEADEYSLVSLDKHFTANVFDINAAI